MNIAFFKFWLLYFITPPTTVLLENWSNVPVDKLLPVSSTACDDDMLLPFHDTLDEFDTTSRELSPPSKVPRMEVACPVAGSTGDGVHSSVCNSSGSWFCCLVSGDLIFIYFINKKGAINHLQVIQCPMLLKAHSSFNNVFLLVDRVAR